MHVMLRGYIPEDEWLVMAELSYFFRVLCAKELSPIVIEEMEKLAPELLCKLEKIFPPGFFNPMQHMILHLPTEARLGGPVKNRWCYATERMQKTLREKCKNKRRIEASMAEAFITEEAANFVTAHYDATLHSLHNPKPRYNVGDPKRRESKLSLFKGKLAPSGVGKSHGTVAMCDGFVPITETLYQIKARQTSSAPVIRQRPRPVDLAIEVSFHSLFL